MLRIRSSSAPALAAGFLALTSCSNAKRPLVCEQDSDCPPGVGCSFGACVAELPPSATIKLRSGAALVTHRPLAFDGTDSSDPNPGGSVIAYSWSVKRAAGTHCDPSPARGTASLLQTIFTCEGDYEVELTVKNGFGLESAPATMPLTIAPSTNPPAASAGADVTLAHRCSGAPLVCSPVTADGTGGFRLAADAMDLESGRALAYSWDWEPPPGVDRSAVSVRFDPGPQVSTPIVHIESPGTRIAGEWTFTASVTDGDGLVTPAQQKVTITNSPPTVIPGADAVGATHTFNQQGQAYVAAGTLAAQIQDPDGDPIEPPELRLVEAAPTGCAFRVNQSTLANGTLAASFDLTALLGQEKEFIGPQRRIEVTARDVNGGEATASVELAVLNRPPTFVWDANVSGQSSRLLDAGEHSVTADCPWLVGCYLAQGASPLRAVDPDGDPLSSVELVALGFEGNSAFTSADGRSFAVKTSVGAPYQFRGADGVSPFTLLARVRDPWESSPDDAAARFRLRIGNRPPHAASPPPGAEASPWYSDPEKSYHAQADFVKFVDDDGDPLSAASASGDAWCNGLAVASGAGRVTCTAGWDWTRPGFPNVAPFFGAHQVSLRAKDAWEEGPATASTVTVRDYHAPSNPGGSRTVDACKCTPRGICTQPTWQPSPFPTVTLPVGDDDQAPVYVSITSLSCGTVTSGAQFSTLQGGASVQLDISGSCGLHTSMNVTASDGLLTSYATYDISVGCGSTGVICGPVSPPVGGHPCP